MLMSRHYQWLKLIINTMSYSWPAPIINEFSLPKGDPYRQWIGPRRRRRGIEAWHCRCHCFGVCFCSCYIIQTFAHVLEIVRVLGPDSRAFALLTVTYIYMYIHRYQQYENGNQICTEFVDWNTRWLAASGMRTQLKFYDHWIWKGAISFLSVHYPQHPLTQF